MQQTPRKGRSSTEERAADKGKREKERERVEKERDRESARV